MKKIFFLSALLSAGVMGFAANQYCGEPTSNENFTFSLTHVNANTYRVQLDAVGEDRFVSAVNINAGINQTAGPGIFLGGDNIANWVVTPTSASIDFETASAESVPTAFYVNYFAFAKDGGGVIEININADDIDWTAKCGGVEKNDPQLSLNAEEVTLDADKAETFLILATTLSDGLVSYESSNDGVASVNEGGLVTALGRGTTTITVRVAETETYAPASKKLKVTVTGAISWDAVEWLENSNEKYKLVVEPEIGSQFGGRRIQGENLWIGFPSAVWGDNSSVEHTAVGAGVSFPLSQFTKEFNYFNFICDGVTYSFILYYVDGEKGDTTAIDQVKEAPKSRKVIENGVLYIEKNGVRYNVLGTIQ
jgi:hypothetical protein